ncbi:MAG: hypothetical protein A2Z34_07920 [Planctomycetes bacterium RBG_16_59_8]|nr:MAG: hypothetical protein A2Z34_07920 [Planctomycetes bacterium RBG_16_59_8]
MLDRTVARAVWTFVVVVGVVMAMPLATWMLMAFDQGFRENSAVRQDRREQNQERQRYAKPRHARRVITIAPASQDQHFPSGERTMYMKPGFHVVVCLLSVLALFAFSHPRETGYLGVTVEAAPDGNGARVVTVAGGSPAGKGGIVKGDIILAVEGAEVASPDDLRERLGDHSPGEGVTIALLRGGKESECRVVLGRRGETQPAAGADASFPQLMRTCEEGMEKRAEGLKGEEQTAFLNAAALAEESAVRVKTCPHPACAISSGFITGEGQYLVTAGHIFRNSPHLSEKIYILLSDGRKYEAKPLKWTFDKNTAFGKGTTPDLALCKVLNPKGDKLPSIELAESVKKGEKILMAGFPKGYGKNRDKKLVIEKDSTNDVLPILNLGTVDKTTDLHNGFLSSFGVAPYPGNSGGPFLNMEGKAVGILTNSDFKQWGWGTRVEWIRKYIEEAESGSK